MYILTFYNTLITFDKLQDANTSTGNTSVKHLLIKVFKWCIVPFQLLSDTAGPQSGLGKLAQWALSFGADRSLLLHRWKGSLHVTINDQWNRCQPRQIIVCSLTLSDRIRGHWRVMYCNRLGLVCYGGWRCVCVGGEAHRGFCDKHSDCSPAHVPPTQKPIFTNKSCFKYWLRGGWVVSFFVSRIMLKVSVSTEPSRANVASRVGILWKILTGFQTSTWTPSKNIHVLVSQPPSLGRKLLPHTHPSTGCVPHLHNRLPTAFA